MNHILTPEDIKKYFLASCILALVCIVSMIYMVATSGEANVLMEGRDTGSGTIDVDVSGPNQAIRMMVKDGEGADLRYTKTKTVDNERLTASMELENGDGSRMTKFVATGKGETAGSRIFIDKISGAFAGSVETWKASDEDGTASFDMTFNIEGQNKVWHANFYALDGNGKPATEESIRGFGNLTVWRHYNVTEPPKTPEDWLYFCASMNRDVHLSDEPGAVYIAPPGWMPDENGTLWRDNTTYYDLGNKTIHGT